MENLDKKRKILQGLLKEYTKSDCAVAFSGGVDSSLLLKLVCEQARKNHTKVYAYTIHTVLHPKAELELTERLAGEMCAEHVVIRVDEMAEAGIENNPKNRCYLCKKCMFEKVVAEAEVRKVSVVLEGTNADDTKEYRPGLIALKELGIKSPLLEAGITKAEVRILAKESGISVADRPSVPCMATRFPYDTRLTLPELQNVERMEKAVHELGFYNVRTRIHGNLVRIEVDADEIVRAVEQKSALVRIGKENGYDYVTVDLEGFRSGSQDLHVR